jgi:hypothetical protein
MKSKVGKFKANTITLEDIGNLFESGNVEDALAEVRTKLNLVNSEEILACDATVTVNDIVYLDGDGVLKQSSNDDSEKLPVFGIVNAKITSNTCTVQIVGERTGFSGLTPGLIHYLSNDGGLVDIAPTLSGTSIIPIGISKNSSTLIILINNRGIINT